MSTVSIDEVREMVEWEDAPLKYLSMRMGQKPFWALYFECHPEQRGETPAVTSFICPPGLPVALEPLFGRDGHTMEVADQYYIDIEAGVLPRPAETVFSPEEEAKVLHDLRDLLNQAADAGVLQGQQTPDAIADDDPVELERVRAEALAELDVVQRNLKAKQQQLQAAQAKAIKPWPTWAKVTISIIGGLFLLLFLLIIASL